MTTDRLHVAFGMSAAGSLKMGLAQLGRSEGVICEGDDLGYGPIDPHDAALRAECFGEGPRTRDDDDFIERFDAFWNEAATAVEPVVWLSRRCVREYAGFLEFLSRREAPPLVVDVAGIELVRAGKVSRDSSMSLGFVSHEMMIENGLFDRATRMSDAEFEQERARWRQLKTEDADLRILDRTGLVSAPPTYFDELILSFVSTEWQRCARVVGNALGNGDPEFHQTGDLFVWWRVRTLCDEGVLEGEGNMLAMHESRVRRPP